MRRRLAGALLGVAIASPCIGEETPDRFAAAVDSYGAIRVPDVDFRMAWTLMGAWIVGGGDEVDDVQGAAGIHATYAQPEAVAVFRVTGRFPNGTGLVKELRGAGTQSMTTGVVSHATDDEGWFVRVRDATGRFAAGPNGKLWDWAYFTTDEPGKTTTTDHAEECLACHVSAKDTDWIYTWGYPVLQGAPPTG